MIPFDRPRKEKTRATSWRIRPEVRIGHFGAMAGRPILRSGNSYHVLSHGLLSCSIHSFSSMWLENFVAIFFHPSLVFCSAILKLDVKTRFPMAINGSNNTHWLAINDKYGIQRVGYRLMPTESSNVS